MSDRLTIATLEVHQAVAAVALTDRQNLADQNVVAAGGNPVADAAIEVDQRVVQHRCATDIGAPVGAGEALLHRCLAAEQVGQRLLIAGQRVHAQMVVGLKDET